MTNLSYIQTDPSLVDVTNVPLVTHATYWAMAMGVYFLHKWFPFVYVTLGVIGNVTSFLITTKRTNRHISTCVFMSSLAVIDSAELVTSGLFYRLLVSHGLGLGIHDRFRTSTR